MKKKTSLKDIAQKVGVSTALVSYVLNDKKTSRIGKDVAKRIKEAAVELNYTTNHIARSLKTNKTFTIGLIVADISNIFFSTLARIVEDEAEKYNYSVIFGSSDESAEKSFKLTNLLLNHQVDGLIISPAEGSLQQIQHLQENEIPFVLIDRYFPEVRTNYVAIDNFKASYQIVKHLFDNGRMRIGLISFRSGLLTIAERKKGYNAALKDNQIRTKKSWVKEVTTQDTKRQVEDAIDYMLSLPEPVDAILFTTNTLSTLALKYINTLEIKVPNDLAIASFDESDASELFYAPITHIKQPLGEMGKLATQILFELIEKNNKITQTNLEAELVIRKSTARGL